MYVVHIVDTKHEIPQGKKEGKGEQEIYNTAYSSGCSEESKPQHNILFSQVFNENNVPKIIEEIRKNRSEKIRETNIVELTRK